MDTPRRWQVASLATAVVGVGIGGLALGRTTSEEIAPIVLEVAEPLGADTADPDPDDPEIDVVDGPDENADDTAPGSGTQQGAVELVPPGVVEMDSPSSPASAASVDSPASADSTDSPSSPSSVDSISSPD